MIRLTQIFTILLLLTCLSVQAQAGSNQKLVALTPHVFLAQSSASNSYTSKTRSNDARKAATAARNEVGGRVISVKPGKEGAGYRVRMLVEGGRVITVKVDSQGRVVNNR